MNATATAPAFSACFHCGNRLPQGSTLSIKVDGRPQSVCCTGCEAAAAFILSQGLGRFYQFRKAPVAAPPTGPHEWAIYDRAAALKRYTHLRPDGNREVSVELDGLHCAACVWLIESSLQRRRGLLEVFVNLGDARAQIRFDPEAVPLSALLGALDQLGYRPRPISYLRDDSDRDNTRRSALRRLAVAGFGMMQVMSFAAALYAGALDGIAPELEQFLRYVSLIVATPVVFYSAQPFFVAAWHSLRARSLGMDVPVALSIGIAYAWSVGTTVRGHGAVYFDSAVMFTFLLLLGRYVEMSLRHRAGQQHDSLNRLLPESALRLVGSRAERVTPDELRAGDRIRILPGESVPADGTIDLGTSEVDESLLSGESEPRVCRAGDVLTAGTMNLNGVLEATVARVGVDSSLAAIARLIDRAQAVRPPLADLADRLASVFVGAILLLAIGVGVFWWHRDPSHVFSVVLAVLVVTCPCALSLATPAALAAATTRLARVGLLVTRSRALERLADADTVMFDKTGTLTCGQPRIEAVEILGDRETEARCLAIAAALESFSTHPVSRAFVDVPRAVGVSRVEVSPGRGIAGDLDNIRYRIGRPDYVLEEFGDVARPPLSPAKDDQSIILLSDRNCVLAAFYLADALRVDAVPAIKRLRALGLNLTIASGDRSTVVKKCAARLHITDAQGELSAADKLALLRAAQAMGKRVVVIGDGVNDAAVLAAADVSVAIGTGTDLARVNADLILIGDGLSGLTEGFETSRRMLAIIRQNLTWAVLYNVTAVPLAACGWLQPWMAAIGMSLSSLVVVMNALRLLPTRRMTHMDGRKPERQEALQT